MWVRCRSALCYAELTAAALCELMRVDVQARSVGVLKKRHRRLEHREVVVALGVGERWVAHRTHIRYVRMQVGDARMQHIDDHHRKEVIRVAVTRRLDRVCTLRVVLRRNKLRSLSTTLALQRVVLRRAGAHP